MRTVTYRKNKGGRQEYEETVRIKKDVTEFYNKHYINTVVNNSKVNDDKLGSILEYEAKEIITNIKNNIKKHFTNHVRRFVNCSYDSTEKVKIINNSKRSDKEKKRLITLFYDELRNVKTDLLAVSNELTSDKRCHKWIKQHKKYIVPKKLSFQKIVFHMMYVRNL